MDINELMFLGDENIRYRELSDPVLHALAVAEDPVISASALRQLKVRRSQLLPNAVQRCLESSNDTHLRAYALELSFAIDPQAALRYAADRATSLDRVNWEALIELMVTESRFFLQNQETACTIFDAFKSIDPRPVIEEHLLDAFMSIYAVRCP